MLITIALERCIMGKVHKRAALGSTSLMIAGAVIAAANDLNFNAIGYAAIAANNLMTALHLVMMKQLGTAAVDSKAMLFHTSMQSGAMLLGIALATGELARAAAFGGAAQPGFPPVLALAAGMGVFINHATMVCARVNGPLTTNVVAREDLLLDFQILSDRFGDEGHLRDRLPLGGCHRDPGERCLGCGGVQQIRFDELGKIARDAGGEGVARGRHLVPREGRDASHRERLHDPVAHRAEAENGDALDHF